MESLAIILADIRSTYNVGSIFRSADGFGVDHIFIAGYTPYPKIKNDPRMPHLYQKISKAIHKTALGAETSVRFSVYSSVMQAISAARLAGYKIASLEQSKDSTPLNKYQPSGKIALVIGNEINGIDKNILKTSDIILEIPMCGKKESFNASVSAAIAMYGLKYPGEKI